MQRNIEGLDKLNKELEEYLLGDASDEHIGFNKLVMVEGMDPKLREALILLHSKYTAELEAVKRYHFKYISNIINSNKDAYLKMEALKNELNKELEKINSRKIFSIPKVVFVAISIVFVFLGFFNSFSTRYLNPSISSIKKSFSSLFSFSYKAFIIFIALTIEKN